jgi:hypothetical protein
MVTGTGIWAVPQEPVPASQIYISEIDDNRLAQANRKLLRKLDANDEMTE